MSTIKSAPPTAIEEAYSQKQLVKTVTQRCFHCHCTITPSRGEVYQVEFDGEIVTVCYSWCCDWIVWSEDFGDRIRRRWLVYGFNLVDSEEVEKYVRTAAERA